MTTLLTVLVLWTALSAVAATGFCLVAVGARVWEQRAVARLVAGTGLPVPAPRTELRLPARV